MPTLFMVLGLDVGKELYQRGFVENTHAQNLEDFEETGLAFNLLSGDGDEGINTHGDPQLGANRVLRASVKGFDAQVLLEPFEEQFNLPALLVELGDQQSSQREVIGQKDQVTGVLSIVEAYPAQFVWIVFSGVEAGERDGLVTAQPCGFIHRMQTN